MPRNPQSVPQGGDKIDDQPTKHHLLRALDSVTEYIRAMSGPSETVILITFKDGEIDFPNLGFNRPKGITEEQIAECLTFCAEVIRHGKTDLVTP